MGTPMTPSRPAARFGERAAPWLVFFGAFVVLVLFRDVRVPLDGCAYAAAARDLLAGHEGDAFRWAHALHVPALALGFRLFGSLFSHDLLLFYQALDIVLGAVGLSILYLLVRDVSGGGWRPVPACVLVLLSWVYWSEAAMADEKMTGFVLALAFLLVAVRHGTSTVPRLPASEMRRGAAAGLLLGLAILMHASSVLVVPAALVLVWRSRSLRFGLSAAICAAVLVVGAYGFILGRIGVGSGADVIRYFSTGVTSYSVLATGVRGMAWLRELTQGLTKVIWAVFSEDGLQVAQILAVVTGAIWTGVAVLAWHHRRDARLQWALALLVTGMLFGTTYAPSAPDSYMILVVPLAVYSTVALRRKRVRWLAAVAIACVALFNGAHYYGFSRDREGSADRRYQQAIEATLAPGDVLVVLDSVTGVQAGTYTILPIHRFLNPQLQHVGSSDFLSNPTVAPFPGLAREGRLYIEGICFETWEGRGSATIESSAIPESVQRAYELLPVVAFEEYSTAYHRRYKNIFRLMPRRPAESSAADGLLQRYVLSPDAL